jgi:hypothetical protein
LDVLLVLLLELEFVLVLVVESAGHEVDEVAWLVRQFPKVLVLGMELAEREEAALTVARLLVSL